MIHNSGVATDGLIFDHVISFPFLVTVRCVRAKKYVHTRISDDVVMYVVVKGGLFEFIGLVCKNNMIVLCELLQYKILECHMEML